MDDLISRQEAIDALMSWVEEHKDNAFDGCLLHWTGIKALLENLPSERQEQRWIPVSERLPEQDQICLICGKNGGIYVARFWRSETLILWTKTGTGKFAKAVAWMPLPNPYKEEES